MGQDRHITVQSVGLLLHIIVVVEQEPVGNTSAEGEDGNTSIHPQELRILGDGNESLTESGGNSVGEKVSGLDERLHAGRSLGVGILKTGDRDENL